MGEYAGAHRLGRGRPHTREARKLARDKGAACSMIARASLRHRSWSEVGPPWRQSTPTLADAHAGQG